MHTTTRRGGRRPGRIYGYSSISVPDAALSGSVLVDVSIHGFISPERLQCCLPLLLNRRSLAHLRQPHTARDMGVPLCWSSRVFLLLPPGRRGSGDTAPSSPFYFCGPHLHQQSVCAHPPVPVPLVIGAHGSSAVPGPQPLQSCLSQNDLSWGTPHHPGYPPGSLPLLGLQLLRVSSRNPGCPRGTCLLSQAAQRC